MALALSVIWNQRGELASWNSPGRFAQPLASYIQAFHARNGLVHS